MGPIAEALGKGTDLFFAKKTWHVEPLDFNDLSDLEDWLTGEYPAGSSRSIVVGGEPVTIALTGIECLDLSKVKHQRFVLWLALRKADPQLGDDDRAHCRYHMTLEDAGRMISMPEMGSSDTLGFVTQVLQISGVMPKPNAPKPEGKEQKKARASRSASSSPGSQTSSSSDADMTATK